METQYKVKTVNVKKLFNYVLSQKKSSNLNNKKKKKNGKLG
jgi:hypothetical protein